VRVKATASLVFISHMVQMKEDALFVISKSGKGFISHMVQMKGLQDYALQLDSTYFISHMVQMKAEAIAKANSIKEALYPTWFR